MRLFRSQLLLLPLLAANATSSVSYVVVRNSDKDSLVRVSADGSSVTTIANGAAGVGLTLDRKGNYIVAARSALLRVTRAGEVTTIASAPTGSEWETVVADSRGDLIVADANKDALWRVSEDGASVAKFAEYGETFMPSELGLVIDTNGDFLLLVWGLDNMPQRVTPALYRITPSGSVSRIPLTGAVARLNPRLRPPVPGVPNGSHADAMTGGALVPDGSGNYLFLDGKITRGLFRLTASGVVTKLMTHFDPAFEFGLARNPETGEVVTASTCNLLRSSADGSSTGPLIRHHDKLCEATAIILDPGN